MQMRILRGVKSNIKFHFGNRDVRLMQFTSCFLQPARIPCSIMPPMSARIRSLKSTRTVMYCHHTC